MFAFIFIAICAMTVHAADQPPSGRAPDGAVWVDTLDLSRMTQRRGALRAGRSIRNLPISMGGVVYPRGIGTRSISEFVIDLHGQALRFESMVGLDDVVRQVRVRWYSKSGQTTNW